MVVWLGYIVYFCAFLCTVTDFSAAEKDSGMKLRMLVPLLSGMSFSHFGELWPREAPPEAYMQIAPGKKLHLGKNFAAMLGGQSELGAVW